MGSWLKRLRGIVGIGAIWSVVGGFLGATSGLLMGLVGGYMSPGILVGMTVGIGISAAGIAGLLGMTFATVLTLAERNRSLDELSAWRAGLWGALGGGGLVAVYVLASLSRMPPEVAAALAQVNLGLVVGSAIAAYGTVSGLMAAATVSIAKRAPDELGAGADETEALLGSGTDELVTDS